MIQNIKNSLLIAWYFIGSLATIISFGLLGLGAYSFACYVLGNTPIGLAVPWCIRHAQLVGIILAIGFFFIISQAKRRSDIKRVDRRLEKTCLS